MLSAFRADAAGVGGEIVAALSAQMGIGFEDEAIQGRELNVGDHCPNAEPWRKKDATQRRLKSKHRQEEKGRVAKMRQEDAPESRTSTCFPIGKPQGFCTLCGVCPANGRHVSGEQHALVLPDQRRRFLKFPNMSGAARGYCGRDAKAPVAFLFLGNFHMLTQGSEIIFPNGLVAARGGSGPALGTALARRGV
ncbi:MAG TPA: hypothetical protein VIM11_19835, partial [Tepidisphaeraceae bacterium]